MAALTQSVRILKDGALLFVLLPSAAIRRCLEEALVYDKRNMVVNYHRHRIDEVSIRCFEYKPSTEEGLPEHLIVPAGFLSRIAQVLRQNGCRALVKDLQPHPRPEVFQPRWDLLRLSLRYRQRDVLEMILKHEYGRIQCPPAFGKTEMLIALGQILPRARIDVTTAGKDVAEQIYLRMQAQLPSIGLVGGGHRDGIGSRIMVYVGKSLHRADGDADLLVVDESHEFATDDYFARLARYRFARRWGFSASQNMRMDGADFELEGLLGPVRINVSYQDAEKNNCVGTILVEWVDVIMNRNPVAGAKNRVAILRRGIWRNKERNQRIAEQARRFDSDMQVLIVVDTVEHAMLLKRLLPEFTLCYSEARFSDNKEWAEMRANGLLPANEPRMTAERRFELKEAFERGRLKKVIATGIWNRGVNFRQLAVLIRADAKNSAIADTQIPGRLSRLHDNKPHGLVIDFLDQFDGQFKRRAASRRSRYEDNGWAQGFAPGSGHGARRQRKETT